jgi:phosphoribosylformylglycinamidine synthase
VIARIFITPKKGVLDPQGKAIASSLHTLGFAEVGDVRMGKYLEIRLSPHSTADPAARVRAMCERLLANGVIEDFRFDLTDDTGAGPPVREESSA